MSAQPEALRLADALENLEATGWGGDCFALTEHSEQQAQQAAAEKLHASADAVAEFALACLECNDGSGPKRADDGRTILSSSMREYAGWLESVYGKSAA